MLRALRPWRFVPLPLLAPILVLEVLKRFYRSLVECTGDTWVARAAGLGCTMPVAAWPSAPDPLFDLVPRLQLVSTATLWVLVCLAALGFGLAQFHAALRTRPARLTAFLWAVLLVAGVRTAYRFYVGSLGRPFVLITFFEATRFGAVASLRRMIAAFGGITTFTASVLVLAVCVTLHEAEGTLPERVAALAVQIRRLQHLLYASGILLVVAVLTMSAIYRWAAAHVADPGQQVSGVVQAVIGYVGAGYSLTLAVIYLPALAVLRARAARLAVEALPGQAAEAREKWRQEQGFVLTVPKQILSPLAILGPLLAGSSLGPLLQLAHA